MPFKWCLLALIVCLLSFEATQATTKSGDVFTSSFLVKFKRSIDSQLATEIAARNGFHNIGQSVSGN